MQVRQITQKKGVVLVEWQNEERKIFRSWVTPAIITQEGSTLYVTDPHAGIPYGENFSKFLQYPDNIAQDIEQELKKLGIWTWADVLQHVHLVKQAYQSVLGIQVAPLLATAAKEAKK